MITIRTKLSVKELSGPLGKSVGYVYKMRMAGFPMTWDEKNRCWVATVESARAWVRRTKFRVVAGRPVSRRGPNSQ
jgi:hypothetical protein